MFHINEGEYQKENKYWKSFSIIDEIKENKELNNPIFIDKIDKIKLLYEELSDEYQNTKVSNNIPLK